MTCFDLQLENEINRKVQNSMQFILLVDQLQPLEVQQLLNCVAELDFNQRLTREVAIDCNKWICLKGSYFPFRN